MIRTLLCAKGKKMTTRDKKLSAIVFLVIGLVFSVIGYPTHKKIVDVKNRCVEKGYAVVLYTEQKDKIMGRGHKTIYRATVELLENERPTGKTAVTQWSGTRYTVDKEIPVLYDPNDTSCIYTPFNSPFDSGVINLGVGAFFLVASAMYFIQYLLSKNRYP